MTYEELYQNPDGLNGGFFKKNFRIKNVSLKNVVKVAKVAIPIATSLIPVGGGLVSGIAKKVLTNKDGGANLIGRIANTATKVSKTKVGKLVTKQAKAVINPAKLEPVEAVNQITPASFVTESVQTQQSSASEATEPVGELTPVKEVSTAKPAVLPIVEAPKSNTMLWIIGGVVLAGGVYLATKKD